MGKKSKNTPSTTSTTGSTEANNTTGSMDRLSEQLNDVMVQVLHNIMKMDLLHQQWMNYLFVLSFIVVIISIYQIYSNFNTNQSYIDITDSRNHQLLLFIRKLPKPIQVLLHIDYSIITHIISTCMSTLLFLFIMDVKQKLQDQQPLSNSFTKIFRHFYFRMTQFCFLPTLLSYYYYYYHIKNKKHPSIPTSSSSSSSSSITHQQFPIVIIYFVIATGCIWFMQHQSHRMYRSYYSIIRLRSELMQKQYEQQQQKKPYDNNNNVQQNSSRGKKTK